jgi:hypothetical protein
MGTLRCERVIQVSFCIECEEEDHHDEVVDVGDDDDYMGEEGDRVPCIE